MDEFTRNLCKELRVSPEAFLAGRFKPVARYHKGMDALIVLMEECSYVASQVEAGSHIWLLRHPDDNRIVGVKIEGFSHLTHGKENDLAWALQLIM